VAGRAHRGRLGTMARRSRAVGCPTRARMDAAGVMKRDCPQPATGLQFVLSRHTLHVK